MRRGSKEFDKIIFYYEPWIDNKRHKVAVKMNVKNDGKSVVFYTEHFKREDNHRRHVDNSFTNPADLYEWIDNNLAELPDVKWDAKILVNVKGSANATILGNEHYRGISLMHSEIEVNAEAIEVGIGSDGKKWKRAPGKPKSIQPFTENIGYGLEKDGSWWKPDDPDDPGEPYSRALLDDTDENRKLLVKFSVRFDQLRDQFFQAFAPEHVVKFLATNAGNFLLNSPANEVEK